MRVGKFYTHVNMLDSMIEVKKILGLGDDSISLIVQWWLKRGLMLDVGQEVIQIKHSDYYKWYQFGE